MPAVWYIGQAAKRTVGTEDWERFGINGRSAVTWERDNGWSVPHAQLLPAQLAVLNNDPLFIVGAPEGFRTGMPAGVDAPDPASKGWTIEQIVQRFGEAGSVANGEGVSNGYIPGGGIAGMILSKKSATDYDTEWKVPAEPTVVEGPPGSAATVTVGTVTTLAAGAAATVTPGGTDTNRTLDFGIPRGATGTAGVTPTLAVGTVTTLAAGAAATVTAGGTATARTFSFGIPRGADGAPGTGGGTAPATANTPFAVRYVGSAWEFASLAAAVTAGLNTSQTIWFIGGTTPPAWARSGDIYTQF